MSEEEFDWRKNRTDAEKEAEAQFLKSLLPKPDPMNIFFGTLAGQLLGFFVAGLVMGVISHNFYWEWSWKWALFIYGIANCISYMMVKKHIKSDRRYDA